MQATQAGCIEGGRFFLEGCYIYSTIHPFQQHTISFAPRMFQGCILQRCTADMLKMTGMATTVVGFAARLTAYGFEYEP